MDVAGTLLVAAATLFMFVLLTTELAASWYWLPPTFARRLGVRPYFPHRRPRPVAGTVVVVLMVLASQALMVGLLLDPETFAPAGGGVPIAAAELLSAAMWVAVLFRQSRRR